MKKAPPGGNTLNYRAAPRPCFIFAMPKQPTKLVEQARAVRTATPRQSITANLGKALEAFYGSVLVEPLPPQFTALMEGLGGSARGTDTATNRSLGGVERTGAPLST
jgi:hypothetical protein